MPLFGSEIVRNYKITDFGNSVVRVHPISNVCNQLIWLVQSTLPTFIPVTIGHHHIVVSLSRLPKMAGLRLSRSNTHTLHKLAKSLVDIIWQFGWIPEYWMDWPVWPPFCLLILVFVVVSYIELSILLFVWFVLWLKGKGRQAFMGQSQPHISTDW